MSKLFHSDTGRIIYLFNEELTFRRRARKRFCLPDPIAARGMLYVYAASHPGCRSPLRVCVNGRLFEIKPEGLMLRWFNLPLKRDDLLPGDNTIELWCDRVAMDGWILGLEGGHDDPRSALSMDGGRNWQNRHMGVYHRMRGEYVVRLRLHDSSLHDAPPPKPIWEDRNHSFLDHMRAAIPPDIRSIKDPWTRARGLASWVSRQWTYRNAGTGIDYTPWDPLTILAWGRRSYGHAKPDPIVMCVHFGVVFTIAALAIGIPSRNLCCTNDLKKGAGHFVSEVWMERWRKWCYIDPSLDTTYSADGTPLSTAELYARRNELRKLAQRGSGFKRFPKERQVFASARLSQGETYRCWAVWPRNDYLSHPEHTPSSHGATAYLETDWLWRRSNDKCDLGMFPYHLEREALLAPPPDEWRARQGS